MVAPVALDMLVAMEARLLSALVLHKWLLLLVVLVAPAFKTTYLVLAVLEETACLAAAVQPLGANQVERLVAAPLVVAVVVVVARQTAAPEAAQVDMCKQLRHRLRQLILMLLEVVAAEVRLAAALQVLAARAAAV
jgi:hypothetical protein